MVVADKTEKGTDGTLHLTKGELLNDQAVLVSKIVDQPGDAEKAQRAGVSSSAGLVRGFG